MNNFRNNKWNNRPQATKEKPHGVARVISKRGFCSRSQAENLVREGRVSLRGKIVHDPDSPAYQRLTNPKSRQYQAFAALADFERNNKAGISKYVSNCDEFLQFRKKNQ